MKQNHGRGRLWHWVALGVIVALALAARLWALHHAYHVNPISCISPDSRTYDNPARAMLMLGRFAASPEPGSGPEFIRTPGYPLFLAANYLIFGFNQYPIIVVQVLLSGLTIGLVFYLALRLGGRRAALIGAVLMAIEPIAFLYSQILLSDTLFTLMVTLCAVAGVILIQERARPTLWALILGLCLAVSIHVRPVGYYLIVPVMAGMLWAKAGQGYSKRQLAKMAGALALPWIVLVGGWQARNLAVAGTSEFSAIQSINLLLYRGAGIVSLRDNITLEEAQAKLKAELSEAEQAPPAPRYKAYRQKAMQLIRENPRLFLKMQGTGMFYLMLTVADNHLDNFMGPWKEYDKHWLSRWLYIVLITMLLKCPISNLLLVGVLFAPWTRHRVPRDRLFINLYLSGLLVYFILVSAGPEANYRLHLPFVPIFAYYSAVGWDKVMHALSLAGSSLYRWMTGSTR